MTAMRLKRYPSPSGGIALGKMGVGATMIRDSILPVGARWVEYLESTGTQYVDTGVIPDINTSAQLKFRYSQFDSSYRGPLGTRTSSTAKDMFAVMFANSAKLAATGLGDSYFKDAPVNEGIDYSVVFSRLGLYVDGILYKIYKSPVFVSAGLRVFLFGRNDNGIFGSSLIGRIHYCKILNGNNEIVRYFRPIAIGTTGYMLDLVSGEYLPYGNKGTGDFVIGPDTNAPAI